MISYLRNDTSMFFFMLDFLAFSQVDLQYYPPPPRLYTTFMSKESKHATIRFRKITHKSRGPSVLPVLFMPVSDTMPVKSVGLWHIYGINQRGGVRNNEIMRVSAIMQVYVDRYIPVF